MQVGLHLLEVGGPRGSPCAVGREGLGRHTQLLRHVFDRHRRRRLEVIGCKPEIPQRTELEGKAQACMGLAVLVDGPVIGL